MKFYTGIGSRNAPLKTLRLMKKLAFLLEKHNYILRSGGSIGSDLAFESGVKDKNNQNIFLPYKRFNKSKSNLYLDENLNLSISSLEYSNFIFKETERVWKKRFNQNFSKLPNYLKSYMLRNSYQVFGLKNELNSEFLIYWSNIDCLIDSKKSGTCQTVITGFNNNVPIINLALKNWKSELRIVLKKQ